MTEELLLDLRAELLEDLTEEPLVDLAEEVLVGLTEVLLFEVAEGMLLCVDVEAEDALEELRCVLEDLDVVFEVEEADDRELLVVWAEELLVEWTEEVLVECTEEVLVEWAEELLVVCTEKLLLCVEADVDVDETSEDELDRPADPQRPDELSQLSPQ